MLCKEVPRAVDGGASIYDVVMSDNHTEVGKHLTPQPTTQDTRSGSPWGLTGSCSHREPLRTIYIVSLAQQMLLCTSWGSTPPPASTPTVSCCTALPTGFKQEYPAHTVSAP